MVSTRESPWTILLATGAVLCLLGWSGCSPAETPEPHDQSPGVRLVDTTLGATTEHVLAPGEVHDFQLEMEAGQVVQAVAFQRGADLVLEWLAPDGGPRLSIDSPIEAFGPEILCAQARRTAAHRLRIRPFGPQSHGPYSLSLRVSEPSSTLAPCLEAAEITSQITKILQGPAQDSRELLRRYRSSSRAWEKARLPHPQAVAILEAGRLEVELGALEQGRHSFHRALELFGDLGDQRQQITASNLLGLVQRDLGEITEAERLFRDALRLARQVGDQRRTASALNNLGLLFQIRGLQLDAIAYFEEALGVASELRAPFEEMTFQMNIGISQTRLADFDAALRSFERALESGARARPTRRRDLRTIDVKREKAWVHHLAGDSSTASGLLMEVLEQSRASLHQAQEAVALDRLGTVLKSMKRYGAALKAYRECQRILEAQGSTRYLASTWANIGWLLTDWGRSEQASEELGRALAIFERIGDRPGKAHTLAGLAHAERELGRPQAAREHIERALDLTAGLEADGGRRGDRFRSIPVWQDYIDFYIDLLVELHRFQPEAGYDLEAFEVSDESRARGLYEMLLESQLRFDGDIPPELRKTEEIARTRLAALEDRLLAAKARRTYPEQVAGMERELVYHSEELERAQRAIRSASERFESLRSPHALPMSEIRELLDSETTLLSYDLGENRSHLFFVTQDSLEVFDLPPRAVIENAAIAYWHGVSVVRPEVLRQQIRDVAEHLVEILLAPVSTRLQSQRLIVLGDGVLHYLPFAALPFSFSDDPDQRLVDHFEIVHLPSIGVIELLRRRAANRPQLEPSIAILADPFFGQNAALPIPSQAASAGPPRLSGEAFDQLPYTRIEAKTILEKLGDSHRLVAMGREATTSLVKSGRLEPFSIVHFATHGLIDETNPRLSGIALATADEEERPLDGFLSLSEIYELELQADLVVLSACRTALGRHVRGVGILGLARGFFYAGASRLLVSLWDVDDEATAVLMDHFYDALLVDRLPPPAALRKAQLSLKSDPQWSNPYYWAGFVLQGDFAPLPATTSH